MFWWIQRNERRKTLELEQRVSMLTQVVQDTAQNVNTIIERSERNTLNQGVQQGGQSSQNVQQSTQGTQVSLEDIINETETDQVEQPLMQTQSVDRAIINEETEDEETDNELEQDDSSDDGNYSELDSLTDEDEVNDGDGNHDVERIEVSDIEDIQSVSHDLENTSSQLTTSVSNDTEPTEQVKTINLETPQLEQTENSKHSLVQIEQCVVDEELQKQYNKMTVKELRKIGEEKEIEQVDKMKKKTIVDLLSRVPIHNSKTTTNDDE